MQLPLVVRVLWPDARRESRPLATAAALGVVGIALELATPWPLAVAVDGAIDGTGRFGLSASALLVVAGVGVVVLAAVAGLVDMAGVVAAESAAERVGARLRHHLFDSAQSLSLRWHDRTPSGELLSRVTTDVGRLLDALVALTASLVPNAVRLVVVLGLLWVVAAQLALIALVVVPLLAVLAVRQRRLVRNAERVARSEAGLFSGTVADLIRNVRAVQAFGPASRAGAVFAQRNHSLREANLRSIATSARWSPIADVVLALGTGLVLVVGGTAVIDGRLSTGQLLVVMAYLSSLYAPVRSLSRLSGVIAKSSASAARVQDVLANDERIAECAEPLPAPSVRDEVRLLDVRFGYTPDRPVLDGFDLRIRAGETVCLLGPSGVGKSTVLHLLLRLYDVDDGAILLDGIDLRDISSAELRSTVAFVPQDPWLFDASIAENISVGASNVTRHAVLAAARTALVDQFAADLPGGVDASVGEGAARLSGGQRRRIALARAVVSSAPLLLLDEPTAALDRAAAAAVTDAIRRVSRGRTTLIVTHDLELAGIADRIVQLGGPDGAHPARPDTESAEHREEVKS